ncbi:MAG: hypothetical protein ACR2QC_03520 [Gammaproteobacteria bacterium]
MRDSANDSPSANEIPAFAGMGLKRPSHSCEGRNLYAEGGNCKLQELQLPAALRRWRFLPSQEWAFFRTAAPPTNRIGRCRRTRPPIPN